ncbi:hypothetical protein ON010_g17612 [Phytophthora cinnamomi]|nr:hypothetical protein ON010_g17612 [Phytophthora cinnamomi]
MIGTATYPRGARPIPGGRNGRLTLASKTKHCPVGCDPSGRSANLQVARAESTAQLLLAERLSVTQAEAAQAVPTLAPSPVADPSSAVS